MAEDDVEMDGPFGDIADTLFDIVDEMYQMAEEIPGIMTQVAQGANFNAGQGALEELYVSPAGQDAIDDYEDDWPFIEGDWFEVSCLWSHDAAPQALSDLIDEATMYLDSLAATAQGIYEVAVYFQLLQVILDVIEIFAFEI